MRKVLLIHAGMVQHYRCAIYSYLSSYLRCSGYQLVVLAGGVEGDCQDADFTVLKRNLNLLAILACLVKVKPKCVIFFTGLRSMWLYPSIVLLKVLKIGSIYWGHGVNLQKVYSHRRVYSWLHGMSDAIVLYANHLRDNIHGKYQQKVFIANNTLNLSDYPGKVIDEELKKDILNKYGINTPTNVVFVGRVQKRKRVLDLVEAFSGIEATNIGLIIIGPDPEGIMDAVDHPRVFKIGPLYGHEARELLSVSSICCIPGSVGLSIVDAFHFGLPLITERVNHGPEIMYLKDETNGFVLPKGDIRGIRQKILELVQDSKKLRSFSLSAQATIAREATIDGFCLGFKEALDFVNCKT